VVVLGLILLVLCVVLGSGIVLSNTDDVPDTAAFGVSVTNVSVGGLFLLGTAVGAVAMLGLALMLIGAARKRAKKVALKREVQHVRTEQETLAEENARLQEQLEQERTASPVGRSASSAVADEDVRGKHGR
jgi:membrane protein implicated in regulation of membrane protease activity